MFSARKVAFGGARTVSILVSFSCLLVIGYAWKNLHDLNAGTHKLPTIGALNEAPPAPKSAPGPSSSPVAHQIDGTAMNILIVGNDDRTDMTDAEVHLLRTGRDGGSLNTDTMMIVHVPADGSKATIISLPRDSWVQIPGFRDAKLNAAYVDGYQWNAPRNPNTDQRRAAGANLLIKTIGQLTGLTINHFVEVDLIGFYRISNAIGKITVNLCDAVSDPTGSHFVAPAGKQQIVGVRALEFVRQRDNLVGGDLARTARQRYFLTAAFRKIESAGFLLNPGELHHLIQAVDSSIYVDNGFSIPKLAAQLADLNPNNIVGKAIPTDGYLTVDGQSALAVNPTEVRSWVQKLLSGQRTSSGHAHHQHHKPIDSGCIH